VATEQDEPIVFDKADWHAEGEFPPRRAVIAITRRRPWGYSSNGGFTDALCDVFRARHLLESDSPQELDLSEPPDGWTLLAPAT